MGMPGFDVIFLVVDLPVPHACALSCSLELGHAYVTHHSLDGGNSCVPSPSQNGKHVLAPGCFLADASCLSALILMLVAIRHVIARRFPHVTVAFAVPVPLGVHEKCCSLI